ncbi:hypothetical protein BDW74DRAFT_177042 [Aspergillus multicolor]|uniref:uncharacterized protein n=1 Tax=Aspergillus multicolor TaxID=41759 RepID=UPI003CCD510D
MGNFEAFVYHSQGISKFVELNLGQLSSDSLGPKLAAAWLQAKYQNWWLRNDITPHWRSIFRTLNQAVPQTDFAGPGQWPDPDILLVGLEDVLTIPEEQTHFSLWGILKAPLTIRAKVDGMREGSLDILRNEDFMLFNQDGLGSDQGYEVWSGPLKGGRVVVAVINWRGEEREITLDLPDVGLQFAGGLRDIWADESAEDVKTKYTAVVAAHGTMLAELSETLPAGEYSSDIFAAKNVGATTFGAVYRVTSSPNYGLKVTLAQPSQGANITIATISSKAPVSVSVPAGSSSITTHISLATSSNNTITIHNAPAISSIQVTPPNSTYYTGTEDFTLSDSADTFTCLDDFCIPTGSKITNLSTNSSATTQIPSMAQGFKYIEIDYINNEVAFDSAWEWGSNSRNLTIRVNDAEPTGAGVLGFSALGGS